MTEITNNELTKEFLQWTYLFIDLEKLIYVLK